METFLEKYKWQICFLLVGLTLIASALLITQKDIFSSFKSGEKVQVIESQNSSPLTIKVEIAGAVEKPGVYEMQSNERIADLIIKAGGISNDADKITTRIKLSKPVSPTG